MIRKFYLFEIIFCRLIFFKHLPTLKEGNSAKFGFLRSVGSQFSTNTGAMPISSRLKED